MTDPKVVIQAHRLRTAAAAGALLHGSAPVRARHGLLRAFKGSVVLAALVVIIVLVTTRVVELLRHTGR